VEGYHIDDSACAASTLWWPASTFPPSSVEGYHIVDTRMCSPQQRCHRMLFFPAAANSTSLPSAPGQEFQVATDDDYYDDYDEPIYSKPGDRDKL
jgi:hypothetical protein